MCVVFSVILPVRNGWPYVKECVDSVLAQTYPHFELVVLDNQSTDLTMNYLNEIEDPRLRVMTSSSPLSIVESWQRAKAVAKCEFVTLIGHDDRFDPTFLETIVALIERAPDAGLYQAGARLINSEGKTIRACRPVPERELAADYLAARFNFTRDIFGTGYVMRSADYDRLGGIPPFEKLFFADDALWLSLIAGGYKSAVAAEIVSVRIHSGSESASLPSSWSSILLAINQFWDFLQRYAVSDAAVQEVLVKLGPNFMLVYHRNIYILALIEACETVGGMRQDVLRRILDSLSSKCPQASRSFHASFKLRAIEAIAHTPLRSVIPYLWRFYCRLRTRSQ